MIDCTCPLGDSQRIFRNSMHFFDDKQNGTKINRLKRIVLENPFSSQQRNPVTHGSREPRRMHVVNQRLRERERGIINNIYLLIKEKERRMRFF